jgi:predicted RNA-binding protein associated with RNAse of E/G family
MPNGRFIILDEDELYEAYKNQNINKIEYDLAYEIKNKLIDNKIVNVKYVEKLFKRIIEYMEK